VRTRPSLVRENFVDDAIGGGIETGAELMWRAFDVHANRGPESTHRVGPTVVRQATLHHDCDDGARGASWWTPFTRGRGTQKLPLC
jgi:hypothetical protein